MYLITFLDRSLCSHSCCSGGRQLQGALTRSLCRLHPPLTTITPQRHRCLPSSPGVIGCKKSSIVPGIQFKTSQKCITTPYTSASSHICFCKLNIHLLIIMHPLLLQFSLFSLLFPLSSQSLNQPPVSLVLLCIAVVLRQRPHQINLATFHYLAPGAKNRL